MKKHICLGLFSIITLGFAVLFALGYKYQPWVYFLWAASFSGYWFFRAFERDYDISSWLKWLIIMLLALILCGLLLCAYFFDFPNAFFYHINITAPPTYVYDYENFIWRSISKHVVELSIGDYEYYSKTKFYDK